MKINLKNRIKNGYNAFMNNSSGILTSSDVGFWEEIGLRGARRNDLSEPVCFTSVKMLSEGIGKLPLKMFQKTADGTVQASMSDTYRILSLRPNEYMSATTFWTLMEFLCQFYGNSFAYIDKELIRKGRYGGDYVINGVYPMESSNVSIIIDDAGIFNTKGKLFYRYTNSSTGEVIVLKSSDVLHFKTWFSRDGITGESVFRILKDSLAGNQAASDYQNKLYQQGLTASMVMQYSSIFTDDEVKALQEKYADKLTGDKAIGKVIPLPLGLSLERLPMTLVDADFFNLKKYNATQIAAAFGVKPSSLNDYSNSKYASAESESLSFLVDALMYRLKMYEDEINSKILTPSEYKDGYFYKFNEKALLRTDNKSQSEILKNYVQGGIYTPNEARDMLDRPHIEGGDTLLINGSYVPIDEAGAAYKGRMRE